MHHFEHAEPLKTHLQLNVAKLENVNALRVATEDHLRSKRIFKTTQAGNTHDEDSMEVDAVSQKGKGKEKSGKGKRVARKEKKEVTVRRQQNTHDSKVNVEMWKVRRPNLKVKVKSTGKAKSKAVNKSMKLGPGHQTRPHSSQIFLK